ncbi:hypothetical protein BOX15_Mlig034488g1 [Macrostomum lignano]|uniref:Uncharacterized protein n=1 Tax=Macrostomum lignano TaxID=282301 RepID=A0A267GYL4_9PLAT|nr:hypothetical protein BOX15_Mlig034488g1 [Macrostomum lignano]
MPNNFLLTSQPPPLRLTKMSGTGVKLEPPSAGAVQLTAEQLAAMQKYRQAVADACFLFCDSDGDAEQSLERLFSLTPEVLGAADCSGRAPVGAAVAARSWTAASRLLAMAEAAQNLRGIGCRAPDTGEDALALAINAEQPADEAVLRRLLRQRLLHCGCRCCCRCARHGDASSARDCCRLGVDRRGRNTLHLAAAAAAAGRPRVFSVVLEELEATLELLEQRRHLAEQGQSQAPVDADSGAAQTNQAAKAEPTADEAGAQLRWLRESLTEALNSPDAEGWTPVHWLARRPDSACGLRELRDFAERQRLLPDWEARQASGRGLSPLAAAAEAGAVESCELLLTGGLAQVDLEDDQWLRTSPDASVRSLLGRHSRRLLEPLADTPRNVLRRLAVELAQRLRDGLEDGGLLLTGGLGKPLPEPTEPLEDWLSGLDRCCGAARLVLWRLLRRLGQPELAALLEADG